jgi:twitching motility two-component system response regulator PilH
VHEQEPGDRPVWGMRQGAKDYVVKPVVADELIAKIKQFD